MVSGQPNLGYILAKTVNGLGRMGLGHVRWFQDRHGKFGAQLLDPKSALGFVLTARSIPPWRGWISFQKCLLDEWKTIYVMAFCEDENDPDFYVYSGRRILAFLDECFPNWYKPDNEMVNFPHSWGERWIPPQSLAPVWEKVKKNTPAKQISLF